ncbi:hypothetical protein HR060_14650 [Catenovulum sp. SM1970]|uniref:hypothetical protein n=1 Tax=Marinifaba aquimaris TaxID=2741323 RepID=UPI0015734332|nr:hypothetical protein [Marinifaba aquimaris]NTS78096.1 hypothetical protein [Marinifaba aquimaris]
MRILLFLLASSILIGCAGKKDPQQYRQQFLTQINDDGSKWFKYSASPIFALNKQIKRSIENPNNQVKKEPPRSNPKKRNSRSEEKLLESYQALAEQYLEKEGFCSKGYIKLDESLMGNEYFLFAECNESATEQDRSLWKNNPHFENG